MIKKVAVGTMAFAALGTLIFGRDAVSYARTGFTSARAAIRSEVPIEFEIDRARQEVEQLLPDVRKSMHVIAEEQVEVEALKKSLERKELAMESQEEAILSLTSDLKSGDSRFVYAGHSYTQHEVEKDLTERFNRFKIAEDTVKSERALLAAKEKALTTHRSTLESMLSQKKGLELELERLDARVRTIASRKQINSLEIDDSQLNRAKTLISTIEKRLDIEDTVLASEGDFNGLIPVEQEAEETENIALKVDQYFSKTGDLKVVAK